MLQVSTVSPNSAKIKAKVTKTMKAEYSSPVPRKLSLPSLMNSFSSWRKEHQIPFFSVGHISRSSTWNALTYTSTPVRQGKVSRTVAEKAMDKMVIQKGDLINGINFNGISQ